MHVLFVTCSPLSKQSKIALEYAKHLMQTKQELAVYFYQDGAYHSNVPEMDKAEANLAKAWQKFAQETNTQFLVCKTALMRRCLTPLKEFQATSFSQIYTLLNDNECSIKVF